MKTISKFTMLCNMVLQKYANANDWLLAQNLYLSMATVMIMTNQNFEGTSNLLLMV